MTAADLPDTARLFGGPADGRVVELEPGFRGILLCIAMPPTFEDYAAADLASPTVTALDTMRGTDHMYRWDGSRNDAGQRRMRWVSP